MNFNAILSALFGNKSSRDIKKVQPLVDKVKAAYPAIQALSNDELRAKSKEIQANVQGSVKELRQQIDALKAKIEETSIDEREPIFNQIDKLEKEVLDKLEDALNEVYPEVFSIVKETARRFSENEETVVTATDFDRELAADPTKDFITIDGDKAIYHNHWTAGGNDLKWEMVHYDVQLFGCIVLHQGKIAEMATGEGKTLVATCPVFLNALTAAGRQDKIHIYDLPNGSASDRMLARFLRERAGAGQAVDSSILRKIEARSDGKSQGGKLAILTGMVTTGRIFPETAVDPTGAPVDRLTGSYTPERPNPTLFEIVADLKFRDINDNFRVLAAVSANGAYHHDVNGDFVEQLRSFVTVRNAAVVIVILFLIWFIGKFCLRVR